MRQGPDFGLNVVTLKSQSESIQGAPSLQQLCQCFLMHLPLRLAHTTHPALFRPKKLIVSHLTFTLSFVSVTQAAFVMTAR